MEDESLPDGKPEASSSPDNSRMQSRNATDDQDVEESATNETANVAADDPSRASDATRTHANATSSLLPDENSILFGRGKSCNNHPGNIKMRLILNKYRLKYQQSVRGEKFRLVQRVFGELKDAGMIFLKPNEGQDGWMKVADEAAIQKVGHALRNTRGGGSHQNSARSGELPAGDGDGGMPGMNSNSSAEENSTAAHNGSVQAQMARIHGLASLSMPYGPSLSQGGGLIHGGAGDLFQRASSAFSMPSGIDLQQGAGLPQGGSGGPSQQSSSAASLQAFQQQLAQSALSRLMGAGLPRSDDLGQPGAGGLVQNSSSFAVVRAAQEQLAASQGLPALSAQLGTSLQSGNSLLSREMLGISGNSILDPLLALENQRREMELFRLRSALLAPIAPVTLPGAVPSLSADQLYASAQREYQLRQLLLRRQQLRDSDPSLEQSEEENQRGEHH